MTAPNAGQATGVAPAVHAVVSHAVPVTATIPVHVAALASPIT
jgi:hypothetical protein